MILFIHGFASCGLGNKSQALRDYFGAENILLPDLPHQPTEAIGLLERLIEQHAVDTLIGSSLGGYYATWLNRKRSIPSILVNPAVAPYALLNDYIGEHQGCNGQRFELMETHLQALRNLHRPTLRPDERYLVLLQTGDEILDYRQAAAYYADYEVVVEQGGDHRFQHFENYLPRIAFWRSRTA